MNGKKILNVLTHTLSTTTTATGGFGDDDMTAEGQTSSGVFWFSFFFFFFAPTALPEIGRLSKSIKDEACGRGRRPVIDH